MRVLCEALRGRSVDAARTFGGRMVGASASGGRCDFSKELREEAGVLLDPDRFLILTSSLDHGERPLPVRFTF